MILTKSDLKFYLKEDRKRYNINCPWRLGVYMGNEPSHAYRMVRALRLYEYALNNWTESGLQYYLNEENGYYGTIKKYEDILLEETYYLGNVTVDPSTNYINGTIKQVYAQERGNVLCGEEVVINTQDNNCNIWNGSQTSWTGYVSLLYPSDYAYAADRSNWERDIITSIVSGGASNNWLNNVESSTFALLSPSANYPNGIFGSNYGLLAIASADSFINYRPVLTLNADIVMIAGEGSYSNPYTIVD